MIRLIQFCMRLGYKLTWPLAGLFLHNSKRVRVLVKNQRGEILLVKSTYGSQKWELPGGGVARGEDPVDSAVRELYEETGLRATKANLVKRGEHKISSRDNGWPVMNVTFFAVTTYTGTVHIMRPLEIVSLGWFSPNQLPSDVGTCAKAAFDLQEPISY